MTEEIKSRLEQIRSGKVPKGYRQSPSGVIPRDWHDVKMSDVTEEIKETAGDKEYETLSISAGVGFVNQAKKFGREMSGAQYSKYTVLRHGDFSYNKGNSNLYPQGCIYRLNDREEAAVPNVFESFRFDLLNGDYYEQLFVSGYLNKQLYSKINHGVRDDGLLNLTGKDFYGCHLPVPPLPEQQKIAEILMQCDKVIELHQCKIEEIKKLKKACLSKMFPKQGNNVPELRFPEFSEAWKQRKLGEIVSQKISNGLMNRPGRNALLVKHINVINMYTPDKIHVDDLEYFDATESDLKKCNVEPGDIFVTRSSLKLEGIAEPNVLLDCGRFVFDDHLMQMKLLPDYFSPFVKVLLETAMVKEQFMAKAKTATMTTIGQNDIASSHSLLPKYTEQKKIASFFEVLDNLIALHQRELEEMQKYKKALMQLLLTGIVRVNA